MRAVVRPSTDAGKVARFTQRSVQVYSVDMANADQVVTACQGVACVVSALAGLRPVVIDTQRTLLDAAVVAGVPRFIPSDFSLDFTPLTEGQNRNLDLRREFHRYLAAAPIAATTVFNGPFMDLLTDQMPMILFSRQRVLYWGDADQPMDFTTVDDTAAYTARVALDASSPRYLRIAGDQRSARQIAAAASKATGTPFRLFRAGGHRGTAGRMSSVTDNITRV